MGADLRTWLSPISKIEEQRKRPDDFVILTEEPDATDYMRSIERQLRLSDRLLSPQRAAKECG